MSTAIPSTDSNRPALPPLGAGLRWRVDKNVYGTLVLFLEEEITTFWGNKKWKVLDSEYIDFYDKLEPHQIKGKVEQVAKTMLDLYTKKNARSLAARAVVGIYDQNGDNL